MAMRRRKRRCKSGIAARRHYLADIAAESRLGIRFAIVSGAVLEQIGLAVDREDDRAFGGVRLVAGAGVAPDIFAGAADPVMVGEGALEHPALLDLGMLVHGEGGAWAPFEQAGHLALRLVLIEQLD